MYHTTCAVQCQSKKLPTIIRCSRFRPEPLCNFSGKPCLRLRPDVFGSVRIGLLQVPFACCLPNQPALLAQPARPHICSSVCIGLVNVTLPGGGWANQPVFIAETTITNTTHTQNRKTSLLFKVSSYLDYILLSHCMFICCFK